MWLIEDEFWISKNFSERVDLGVLKKIEVLI